MCAVMYGSMTTWNSTYSYWRESILGLPSSHSLHLIPCCDLGPRWTHITLPCPRALCYIPRLEVRTNGDVNAAFRQTENVGFQDDQYFGAYNLHFCCGLVSHPPSFTSACYQTGCGVQFRGGS